ncbi:zinc ribbon domain-containing protein [Acidithiobacillus sp.]|uniref:zinc ribbon domain-containing protein n=1 Tax=Acidithiobacillus sp. TaxID=1872118 RepID=UPI003D094685
MRPGIFCFWRSGPTHVWHFFGNTPGYLRIFLTKTVGIFLCRYKAMAAGLVVDEVRPHYTSQTCHHCGAVNKCHKHAYLCTRCGHKAHADANAATNVRDCYGLRCPLVLEVPTGGPQPSGGSLH